MYGERGRREKIINNTIIHGNNFEKKRDKVFYKHIHCTRRIYVSPTSVGIGQNRENTSSESVKLFPTRSGGTKKKRYT